MPYAVSHRRTRRRKEDKAIAESGRRGEPRPAVGLAVRTRRLRSGAAREPTRMQEASAPTTRSARTRPGRQDEVGTIEVGKRGDLALIALDEVTRRLSGSDVAAVVNYRGPRPSTRCSLIAG